MRALLSPLYYTLLGICCASVAMQTALAAEGIAVLQATADTGLYELTPNNNLGAVPEVPAGVHSGGKRSRYLVRFEPASSIPPGAAVTGVALRLVVTVANTPLQGYSLHRMQLPWVEGNQGGNNGATATTGETTWLARYFPETLWTSPGGGSGLDFALVPSAITPLAGQGSTNEISTDAMVMDVQRWLDDPGSNFGWMLRVSDESTAQSVRRIAARESTIGGPLLIVRYLPPDSDRDGIPDSEDACPNTPTGAVVNSRGCSLGQLVPVTAPWRNRGEYVSALAAAAEEFARAGLISRQQRSEIIREAAQTAIPPIHRH